MAKAGWIVALVASLVALILGGVAAGITWGDAEDTESTITYRMFHAGIDSFGPELLTAWDDPALGDQDGLGFIRIAGPLWLVGLGFMLLGLVASEHALWFRPPGAPWAAVAAAAAAAAFLIVALVLYPLGVEANLQWDIDNGHVSSGTDVAWGGGLIVAILATAFALAAVAGNVVSALGPSEDG